MKKILITGGTSGLGLEMAKLFLGTGAEVYVTGRKMPDILKNKGNCHFAEVDFSDLHEVEKSVNSLLLSAGQFDTVICNAGVLTPPLFTATNNGFEYSIQVNFLSHLLICERIINSVNNGGKLKLVFITSPVYRYIRPSYKLPEASGYNSFRTYCETKFYLLLAGSYLRERHKEKDIEILGLDPGIFSSGIYRIQKGWFHKMYKTGAIFMRSPAKVAHGIFRILTDKRTVMNSIYKHTGRRAARMPEINEVSAIFLNTSMKALKLSD